MMRAISRTCLLILVGAMFSACGRHKVARVPFPLPPPPSTDQESPNSSNTPSAALSAPSSKVIPESDNDLQAFQLTPNVKPLLVQTGIASWYGPPYHNRRGSDGKIYNMNAMTAAHRTLPLGSIVRVTNVKTGNSAVVRITDRGPFIEGRILDLSLAAARKTDVVRAGIAQVRLDVLQTPVAIDTGGRWAVQIGSFVEQQSAAKLVNQISRRYQSAKVSSFSSPVGDWWVRVRVLHDDRVRAQEVARDTHTEQGKVFLVRLD